jgi:hypothetical protein
MPAIATGIPTRHLGRVWPLLWPLIKPVYEAQKDKRDLLAGIYGRELQLWGVWDYNGPLAGIVSTLVIVDSTSGSEKHCRIWLVAGVRMSEWADDFITKLIPWAKAEGCTCIDGAGRPGWARIMRRLGFVRAGEEDGLHVWRLDIREIH